MDSKKRKQSGEKKGRKKVKATKAWDDQVKCQDCASLVHFFAYQSGCESILCVRCFDKRQYAVTDIKWQDGKLQLARDATMNTCPSVATSHSNACFFGEAKCPGEWRITSVDRERKVKTRKDMLRPAECPRCRGGHNGTLAGKNVADALNSVRGCPIAYHKISQRPHICSHIYFHHCQSAEDAWLRHLQNCSSQTRCQTCCKIGEWKDITGHRSSAVCLENLKTYMSNWFGSSVVSKLPEIVNVIK